MRAGGVVASAVALLISFSTSVVADVSVDALLGCSAEYYARARYIAVLGQSDPGHVTFLMDRSHLFLRIAESRAPNEVIGCNDSFGLAQGLVICLGPPHLFDESMELALGRLTEIVETTGGTQRLAPCMEDQSCAKCMHALSEMVQARQHK